MFLAETNSTFGAGALRAGLLADDGWVSGTGVQIPGPVCCHFTILFGFITWYWEVRRLRAGVMRSLASNQRLTAGFAGLTTG
jgi:hypothetical protein